MLWSTQVYFYVCNILTRSFYLDFQTTLFLLSNWAGRSFISNCAESILTFVSLKSGSPTYPVRRWIYSSYSGTYTLESCLLDLSLHLADCVWLLCARLCATQATLYQATNVYHWYLVTYSPCHCDFHVIMKDYPCLGVFSVT